MAITKEYSHNELYVYMNGTLLIKRWMDQQRSVVFNPWAYDRHTLCSIEEVDGKIIQTRKDTGEITILETLEE